MSRVYNLGTAVRINDEIGVILGYVIAQSEGTVKPRYIVVPFPEGYKDQRSLKLFDIDSVERLSPGYSNEFTDNITSGLEGILIAGEHMTYEELTKYIKTHSDQMEEE